VSREPLIRLTWTALAIAQLAGCSPEAQRVRDGGPGADPGNKVLVRGGTPVPRAADTTLWPGRAAAPVDRFERGLIELPTFPPAESTPQAQTHTFDHPTGDPRAGNPPGAK
jgi:hypothetical protein